MKIWILLLIAGLLLLWGLTRERFEATPSIQAPPYNDAEKIRIYGILSSSDMATLMAKARETTSPSISGGWERELKVAAGGFLTPAIGDFFTNVFKPATTLLTQADVDKFFETRPSSEFRDIEKRAVKIYFIDQSGVGTSSSSGYANALADLNQGPGYMYTAGATGATGATGAAATGATGTTQGTTAGGTTGGSSVSSAAPNAGPVGSSGKGKNIYGPVFTELGEGGGDGGEDTSKTNQYPELLGGLGDVTSVRTPSGIQDPSKSWQLSQSGALPSTASLGSDPNAAYFPTSRSPGDQDLIPDPYRLSRNYSTSSYSNKTDPVPFLTDFSAFFR